MKKLSAAGYGIVAFVLAGVLLGCGASEPQEEPVSHSSQGSGKFGESNASESSAVTPQDPGSAASKE